MINDQDAMPPTTQPTASAPKKPHPPVTITAYSARPLSITTPEGLE